MIAPNPRVLHANDFNIRFESIFKQLCRIARDGGIDRAVGFSGSSRAEDAEDFAQECLIEYARVADREMLTSVDESRIMWIARKRLYDAWRKRGRLPTRENVDLTGYQVTECTRSFGSDTTRGAIMGIIKPQAYDILLLRYVGNQTCREIAAKMGLTIDGVRSSIKRSRKSIARHLGQRS